MKVPLEGELDDTGDTEGLHTYSMTLSSVFVPKFPGMQGPGRVRTWVFEDQVEWRLGV